MRNTAHGPRFPIIGKSELGYPAPKRLEADGMLNNKSSLDCTKTNTSGPKSDGRIYFKELGKMSP